MPKWATLSAWRLHKKADTLPWWYLPLTEEQEQSANAESARAVMKCLRRADQYIQHAMDTEKPVDFTMLDAILEALISELEEDKVDPGTIELVSEHWLEWWSDRVAGEDTFPEEWAKASHWSFPRLAAFVLQGAWADVAAKAKRLVQTGAVTIMHNTPTFVMGHVIGDHGEYNVEISRHDPNSSIIEQSQCECEWEQYRHDRTRKYKEYENRPCSHILATYWKARSTPLDVSGMDADYQIPHAQKRPTAPPGQDVLPGMAPEVPTPQTREEWEDAQLPQPPPQVGPDQLPSTGDLTVPKQPQSPFAVPKQPNKPPQRMPMRLFDVGPYSGEPAPVVSVPGATPPTPENPVQLPGTFSRTIPVFSVLSSEFHFGATDELTPYFEEQQLMSKPIYVALKKPVTLELSGQKIPIPGAAPIGTSQEGVPLYRYLELGWNPVTQIRENADVNEVGGAPEQKGIYAEAPANKRAEVLGWDSDMQWVYIAVPLNYAPGEDARLHAHSLRGWVSYDEVRPIVDAKTPWRSRKKF